MTMSITSTTLAAIINSGDAALKGHIVGEPPSCQQSPSSRARGTVIYPPLRQVLPEVVLKYVRVVVLTALFCRFIYWPLVHLPAQESLMLTGGLSERTSATIIGTLTHVALYYLMNVTFLAFDVFRLFEQYKLHRTRAMMPRAGLLRDTMLSAIVDHFFVQPLFYWYLQPIGTNVFGSPSMTSPIPTFPRLCVCFLFAKVCNDLLFYWAHRLLHDPSLYKRVHKQHHSYVGTIGFAAEYAHWFEGLVANVLPTILPGVISGFHPVVMQSWILVRVEESYETHSGYAFIGTWPHRIGLTNAEGAAFHDFHHSRNSGNFSPAYMDYFFGTMDSWLELGGVQGYLSQKKTV